MQTSPQESTPPSLKSRERSLKLLHSKPLTREPEKLSPTSAMMLRTSSLSPARNTLLETSTSKKRLNVPIPGTQASLLYTDCLTNFELKEITKFSEVYFLGEKKAKTEGKYTDTEGRYKGKIGDHLAFRYEIIAKLGKGTFGNVYKCYDHKRDLEVAIKIMRNVRSIHMQADIEIENLEKIGESDPEDSKSIVKMRQVFDFRGHICICFELLSYSLYQFLRSTKFQGISKNIIKRIAVQVLIGLRHIHGLGFIHCDLKPENILLKHENKSSVKIIDFGSATYKCTSPCAYIQSRYYRAPEIILGGDYSEKIDIWSFGCVIYELYSGRPLFAGESEVNQLMKIMQVLGVPSADVIRRSKRRNEFFNGDQPRLVPDSRGVITYPGEVTLVDLVEDAELSDFLKKCLEIDWRDRLSAEAALKHPWIKSNPHRHERCRDWLNVCNT